MNAYDFEAKTGLEPLAAPSRSKETDDPMVDKQLESKFSKAEVHSLGPGTLKLHRPQWFCGHCSEEPMKFSTKQFNFCSCSRARRNIAYLKSS